MAIREVLNKNAAVVTIGSVVIIAIVLVYAFWPKDRAGKINLSDQVYFYDLNTGSLIYAPRDSVPPIDTESGPNAGVKAVVASCGGCGENEREIVWMERWTPQGKQAYVAERDRRQAAGQPLRGIDMRGLEMRTPAEDRWFPREGSQGLAIQQHIMTMCDGKPARICDP